MRFYANKKGVESNALTSTEGSPQPMLHNKHKRPTPQMGRERSSYSRVTLKVVIFPY